MMDIEQKASSPGEARSMLEGILASASRPEAGPTAPSCGLFLWDVEYGERKHGHARRKTPPTDTEWKEDSEPPEAAARRPRLVPGLGYLPS